MLALLRCHYWCITGVTTWWLSVAASSRVTRAESWARLRGGSSVYSAVCSTVQYTTTVQVDYYSGLRHRRIDITLNLAIIYIL